LARIKYGYSYFFSNEKTLHLVSSGIAGISWSGAEAVVAVVVVLSGLVEPVVVLESVVVLEPIIVLEPVVVVVLESVIVLEPVVVVLGPVVIVLEAVVVLEPVVVILGPVVVAVLELLPPLCRGNSQRQD
jgi:hypothetical protein